MRPLLPALLLLALATGCVELDTKDNSDAARRKRVVGHWYDRYSQDLAYAQGDTHYRRDGTFTASYESVSPGTSAQNPTQRETVQWSGKWKVQDGMLVEDITAVSDASRAPKDRPMMRYISEVDGTHLLLRNLSGNINEYGRKRPEPPKVEFVPGRR